MNLALHKMFNLLRFLEQFISLLIEIFFLFINVWNDHWPLYQKWKKISWVLIVELQFSSVKYGMIHVLYILHKAYIWCVYNTFIELKFSEFTAKLTTPNWQIDQLNWDAAFWELQSWDFFTQFKLTCVI